VGKRVAEAIQKMSVKDPEGALIPASIAVDATAIKEFPNKRNNISYKQFINHYLPLITKVSLGGLSTTGLRFGYFHPDITPDSEGEVSIEQIFYHIVRCGLLHNAKLPDNLIFTNKSMIGV
jgi:hypothetical protein